MPFDRVSNIVPCKMIWYFQKWLSKTNFAYKKFSRRFLATRLRVNKTATKSFSKICRSKSNLNCRSRHTCIKFIFTHKWWEKLSRNPGWRAVMGNFVSISYYKTKTSQKKTGFQIIHKIYQIEKGIIKSLLFKAVTNIKSITSKLFESYKIIIIWKSP